MVYFIVYNYLKSLDVNSIEAEITGMHGFNPVGNVNDATLSNSKYGDKTVSLG
jgi:hypothetical protein